VNKALLIIGLLCHHLGFNLREPGKLCEMVALDRPEAIDVVDRLP
jgi:hypothetical protein